MSDGTTSIQVAPTLELEPDMKHAFDFFTRAANAIVERSSLSKEVVAMREEIDNLRRDLDNSIDGANHLSERLDTTRSDLASERARADKLEAENYRHRDHISELETEVASLKSDLDSTRSARDRWIARANDSELVLVQTKDQLETAEATLAKIRHDLGIPTPVPQPVQEAAPQEAVSYESKPSPTEPPAQLASPSPSDSAPAPEVAEHREYEETIRDGWRAEHSGDYRFG